MTRLAPFLVWTVQVPLSAIALAISLLAAGCFTRTVAEARMREKARADGWTLAEIRKAQGKK